MRLKSIKQVKTRFKLDIIFLNLQVIDTAYCLPSLCQLWAKDLQHLDKNESQVSYKLECLWQKVTYLMASPKMIKRTKKV